MTRINCGIKPSELSTKHLIAELREIKRIPNQIYNNKVNIKNIPPQFSLGTGHVKFFYNKLKYLYVRYLALYQEAKHIRGFSVNDYSDSFIKAIELRNDLNNNYTETPEDRMILIERLKERDSEFYKFLI